MTGDDLGRAAQRVRDRQVAEAVAAERQRIAALLRKAAAGRREYRRTIVAALPDDPGAAGQAAVLETEAHILEAAARVVEGDLGPLCGWLPSWRWTGEMVAACGDSATGSSAVSEAAVHRITHAPSCSAVLAGPGHPKTMPQSESLDSPKGES